MSREKFVSDELSLAQFQDILRLFQKSDRKLGEERNTIKVITFQHQQYVLKSFKTPNYLNRLIYRYIRKSKARRSFENARYLLEHQVGTPRPVAYFEAQGLTGLCRSYYLSEFVDYDFTFREIINDDSVDDKPEILIQYTRFIYNMHESNIFFLDNSPGNTLIKKVEGGYDFYLVDLNRMKFYNIPLQDRIKNFERLAPSKWIFEIIGKEYARLYGCDPQQTVEQIWAHVKKFQDKFYRKRRIKHQWKNMIKSS
ncbi:MAG: lipopolysaccharide kinase InaA family protein [Nonlabens sp.]